MTTCVIPLQKRFQLQLDTVKAKAAVIISGIII